MWPFKRKACEHPIEALAVVCQQTIEREDADFDVVTYHLYCQRCGAAVHIKHARLVGGVAGFLERSIQRELRDTPNAGSNEATP